MAKSTIDRTSIDPPGAPGAKLPEGKAKQGQNVRGMVTVLVVSVVLVGAAFAAMVALSSQSDEGKRGDAQQEMLAPVGTAPPPP